MNPVRSYIKNVQFAILNFQSIHNVSISKFENYFIKNSLEIEN